MQQHKYSLANIVVCSLLIGTCLTAFFPEQGCAEENRKIYVKGSYPYETGDGTANRPYRRIQQAIDLAHNGDEIFVFEGVYNETLLINKQVNITGLDRVNTTICKRGDSQRYYLIEITADNVVLEDLNITDPTGMVRTALLRISSDYVHLFGIRLTRGNKWGIYFDHSEDNTIGFLTIDNMSDSGIHAEYSHNNVYFNNSFYDIGVTAVYLTHSDNCIVNNNTIKRTKIGVDFESCSDANASSNTINNCTLDGIRMYAGQENLIQKNVISYCNRQGIFVSSSLSDLLENTLNRNQIGISLSGSSNRVTSNVITSSVLFGLMANSGTKNNVLSENEFLFNAVNAQENGQNHWYYQEQGNYWDDYDEGDRDLNGIGDVSYTRMGGIDMYPIGKFLKPPLKPSDPSPIDGKDEVGLSVVLKVKVTDADSSLLNVYFYNASDHLLMGYQLSVRSGTFATCSFTLPFQTTFFWYAVVDDGKLENQSDIWFFTTRQIPPLNQKPVANPGGPYSSKLGKAITFDGTASNDPDGSLIFYRWNFGDGSSEIHDEKPSHTYTDPGVYTVKLTVVDNAGRSAIANTTATIEATIYSNQPPIAIFSASSSITENQAATFDASASYDTDGTIVGYRWDFNADGEYETAWLTTTTASYTFDSSGSFLVTLQVKDNENATTTYPHSVSVQAAQTQTPGFELPLVFLALLGGILLYYRRKQRI